MRRSLPYEARRAQQGHGLSFMGLSEALRDSGDSTWLAAIVMDSAEPLWTHEKNFGLATSIDTMF